eukprot:CAMPEP_0184258294 /NCGR_PEP_ID=MMETSP0977-20130417/9923_1 /TAXON_ID=483370 /ORGANISM="non described non described, Strain CCMP2097" /LENGTH=91 /DNA_ID=CAMNT_0026563915 /DNA_START=9 /DNA_END=280 /DNA_ORIENTATION=-
MRDHPARTHVTIAAARPSANEASNCLVTKPSATARASSYNAFDKTRSSSPWSPSLWSDMVGLGPLLFEKPRRKTTVVRSAAPCSACILRRT